MIRIAASMLGSFELKVTHVIWGKRKAIVQEVKDAPCKLHPGASPIFWTIVRRIGEKQFLSALRTSIRGTRVLMASVVVLLSPIVGEI